MATSSSIQHSCSHTASDGRVGTGGNHPAHQTCLLHLIVISVRGLAAGMLQCSATNHWISSVANLVQTSCLQIEIGFARINHGFVSFLKPESVNVARSYLFCYCLLCG